MARYFGGPPNSGVYGSAAVPAEQAWNPAKGGGAAVGLAGTSSIVPYIVIIAVIWILAERRAKASIGGRASAKL